MLPHLDAAYSLARYLVRDPAACDEIVQDSFERALRGFANYRGGSPKAWLLAIVRNRCHDEAISAKRIGMRIVACEDLPDDAGDWLESAAVDSDNPEEQLIRQQDAERIRAHISDLPEPFREALVLREIEDMSYKEIAQVTGVALGTVMSRLSRARAILTEALFSSEQADAGKEMI